MLDPSRPTFRARLARGEPMAALWLALGAPALAELAARALPDAIVLDLQHGLWDRAGIEAAAGVVPPSVPLLARVAENRAAAIGTALDAGCEGVIVPLVESGAEAAAAVAAARYPPHGLRSGGGIRPLMDFPAHVAAAREVAAVVMIETAAGVARAAEIAAVPGLDMVFIGTGDLALSLGAAPGEAAHEGACRAVLAACRAAGLPCGIFTMSPAAARARAAEGYALTVAANDAGLIAEGFAGAVRALRGGPG